MNQLPLQFTSRGFIHEQITRSEKAAVYKRWKPDGEPHFEVVIPNIATSTFTDGAWVECEPRETYPASEQWGYDAWTFPTIEVALAKFEIIK